MIIQYHKNKLIENISKFLINGQEKLAENIKKEILKNFGRDLQKVLKLLLYLVLFYIF
jgi:hypothetical protein